MKAIVSTTYGSPDVLEFKEVEKPIPGDNEVLVKVYAASVNALDWRLLRGRPAILRPMMGGLLKPKNKILGADIAGKIEAVGKNVTRFQPGDEVFGDVAGSGCGGFAEYAIANENSIVLKPAKILFEVAAAIPVAGLTALQGLRDKGKIRPGQTVLIQGASGGVGTFAVQIAKYFGAKVTAVCSTGKIDMVRSIGADQVIDYTKEDFTKSGQKYDLILAANGYHPLSAYKRALNPGGNYVAVGGTLPQIFQALIIGPWNSMFGNKKMGGMMARMNSTDLHFLSELLETGKIVPVIDRRYTLNEVPEAIRYLEEGHPKGKVVIIINSNDNT